MGGKRMKIITFNGSPRIGGNTEILLREVCKELEKNSIETEHFQLGGKLLHGCTGCRKCVENKNEKCVIETDSINEWVQKIKEADGILLGSPVYFGDITPETKAFIDRVGYVTRANGHLLKQKIGAAVIAVRRAGGLTAFDSINRFFLINGMIVPGSSYWNIGIGGAKGDVLNDAEGLQTMQNLGKNIAWLLKKIQS
jgi:multimeric flavodoxin WrbA